MSFINKSIQLDIFYPSRGMKGMETQIFTATDAPIEVNNTKTKEIVRAGYNLINADFDVGDGYIRYTIDDSRYNAGSTFASTVFNGYILSDVYGTINDIVGVKIIAGQTTFNIPQSAVSFTTNEVAVDVSGLSFKNGQVLTLDVGFRFTGTAAADYLLGAGGSDLITGEAGNDHIVGLSGDDSIIGGAGDDGIYGGSGDDRIEGDDYGNLAVTGNDLIHGDDGNDTILAGGGDDLVFAGNGTDVVVADAGNDLVYGGEGTDYIDGRAGADQLFGEAGNDVIFGDGYAQSYGFSSDTIYGGSGNDTLMGESGERTLSGALDVIHGEAGNDQIFGGGGNDWIYGGIGADVIDGGEGSDFIVGGTGADVLVGSGNSQSVGGPGATTGGDLFSYSNINDGGDTIYGFDLNFATGNDGIDLSSLFDTIGYHGNTPRGDGVLYIFQNGANADVYVDATGAQDGVQLSHMVTLDHVAASNLTESYFLF